MIPENTLIKYVRDKKGLPKGIIVAVKRDDDTVSVHWSYCRKSDTFNKKRGLEIAINRALLGSRSAIIPRDILKEMKSFNERVERYYRNANFESWFED